MNGATLAAAGMAAVAVLGLMPRSAGAHFRSRGRDRSRNVGIAAPAGTAVVLAMAAVSALPGLSVTWAVAVLVATGTFAAAVRAIVGRYRGREQRRRRRREVIEVCDALVAEMHAGQPAQRAVTNACSPWPELSGIVATSRLGGDVAGAFANASHRPGAEGLRLVAAGWQVSGRSGAGLAAALDRIATSLRADEEAHAEVLAALGPPRATAKLLATLPVVGLALGTAMGVEPLGFLLTTDVGNGCLAAGVTLAMLGLWWVERLADAVES